MSEIWPPTRDAVARAADRLCEGRLVGMPTETVYGLAGDATQGEAVAAIYETKGRPSFNPLIVHVLGAAEVAQVAVVGELAERLIAEFWPGPLTLVLPSVPDTPVASLATAGLETVAVRSPAHPVARALLEAAGRPVVAPSANRSGRISPTSADHVAAELTGEDIAILDGGLCEVGLESTIVGLVGPQPTLLRPGAITKDDVAAVLGMPVAAPSHRVVAPGMLTSHYAPNACVRLRATRARDDELLLGFGGTAGATLDLSASGDLKEAAANLFASLRALDDAADGRTIAVAPVPNEGLGAAINDRLQRAAAPRPGYRSLWGLRQRRRQR